MRYLLFLAVTVAALFLSGCGDAGVSPAITTGDAVINPTPSDSPEDPFEGIGEDNELLDSRSTSAVYTRFFLDSVNHQSTGRWTITDTSGGKAWTLSNT